MSQEIPSDEMKAAVRDFWDAEPCGTRYLDGDGDFRRHAEARYRLEPYIHEFAGFAEARGLRVLEVGVGMGADYLEWLRAGAIASGIDLSSASAEQAAARAAAAGLVADVQVADAESLPFDDASFDVVYSYGVMHHSPDTPRCIAEAHRVLKPGGKLRIMVYHHPSLTALMLWLRFGILERRGLRGVVYDHLESPGTKAYTVEEGRELLAAFRDVRVRVEFSPSDLLLSAPSARYEAAGYRLVWRLFPRAILRRTCKRLGMFLLIEGVRAE